MTADPKPDENIILVDDSHLFGEITGLLASSQCLQRTGIAASPLSSGGTGFAGSRRFQVNSTAFNFLLMSAENAQPFAYLTLGQRALRRSVPLIVAIAQAQSLDTKLYPGDIALVSEAVALPYPALYKNVHPTALTQAERDHADLYQATPKTVKQFSDLLETTTCPATWQKSFRTIRTGYAKHPTWRGGLEVWAPEQLEAIKASGISTISEAPAGVYEVQRLCPDSTVICFNMIKGPAGADNSEWDRRKDFLVYPAMRLIVDIIAATSKPSVDA